MSNNYKSFADALRSGKISVSGAKKKSQNNINASQKNTWFQGGSFEDGYQFGDVTKAILGTTADVATDIVGGAFEIVEGTIDTGAYLVGGVGDLFGAKDFSKGVSDFIAKDIINVSDFTNNLVDYESSSLLGARADSLVQSGGQLAAQIGLQAVGVPWWVTSAVSSFGGSVEGAFQEGATYGQAGLSAAISAGAELLTEKLFGGSGLGEKGLINVDGFTKGISNKVVKSLVDYGIDLSTNAGEEVLSSVISRLANTLYNGQSFAEALGSEEAIQEYIDSAIGGALLGGAANIGNITRSVKGGKDYRTGLTANEQKVYDAEYKARAEEAEKGGKRLSGNDKRKLHDDILSDMAKGRISTDVIEKALGGDYNSAYQKATEAQKSLQNEKNKLKSELDKLSGIRKSDMTDAQANRLEELRGKLKRIDKEIAETKKTAPSEELKSMLSGAASNVTKDSLLAESYNAKAKSEKIVNKLTGEEIDGNTYNVLERLGNGDDVSSEEIANLKEVKEGEKRAVELRQTFIAEHPEFKDLNLKPREVGTYLLNSSERIKLRDKIIRQRLQEGSFSGIDKNGNEEYNGDVKKDRRLDIVIGLPASGKSSSIVNPLSEYYHSAVIDSDIIKRMLPEFNDGWGGSLVHEESSQVNMKLLEESMNTGNNIVLPIVGSKVESVENYIAIANKLGYRVNIHLNELSNAKATGRVLRRYFSDGRFIDPAYVSSLGNDPTEVYKKIKQRGDIDGYSRWNNDVAKGQRPKLAEISGNNKLYALYSASWGSRGGRISGRLAQASERAGNANNQIKQNNKASSKDGAVFDGRKKFSIAPDIKSKTEVATPKAPNLGNVPIRSDIKPKAKTVDLGDLPIREDHKAKAAEAKQTPKTETKAADGKERAFIATATDSKAVGGLVTSDAIPDDVKYYKPITNKDTLDTANKMLNADGFEKAKAHFKKRMESNSVTVEDIVLGERLIQEAAKAGDAKTASELIVDVAALGTELGQKVQALSIIRRLSPEGQLMALERVVKRGQTKGDKTFNGVEITDGMKQRILEVVNEDGSFDQDELNAAVEDVKQQIADKMGVTLSEKLNEWRYLSMLGNPKTHIRNAASNAVMAGERGIKNAIARSIEDLALSGKQNKSRTKTWKKATETVKLFAKETTFDMADVIAGDPKYAHQTSIKAKRKIFGNKTMDAASGFNSKTLEAADTLFSRSAFRATFAEYLTANGIKTADDIKNNPELVKKAKDYALEEAYKATFRQESELAKRLNNLERQNRESGKLGGKIANVAMGAIMPFKKTPINVAKTAVSYSPAGFVRDAVNFFKMRKGEIDASEFIDGVAQSLTGTALLALGVALADAGVLNGAGDDDKEAKYDYQLGEQSYSLNIGGDTYSISWLSPSGVPLLMGATIHELMVDNKGFDAELMLDAATKMLDPVTEMSFVSGLTDVLSSYESGPGAIIDAAETAVQSYVTQYVPTLLSQTAQTFDTKKRITKASPDSKMPFLDETYKKVAYKIPGLRNTLEASTDIWGNDVKQAETLAGRAFEAFLSPANRRQGIATEADAEIKRLYQQTGESGIIPSIPDGYINFGGDKYEMTAKEYTDYKHAYGQTALNLMNDLFKTETYKNASDDKRADMVEKVYEYAREMSKNAFFATRDIAYTNAEKDGKKYFNIPSIKGAIDNDMSVEEYSYAVQHPNKYPVVKAMGGYEAYKQYSSDLNDMVADKDVNGKTVTNSRKEKVVKYINDLDLGWGEKLILFKSEYTSDNRYNYEIIEYLEGRDDISRDEMISILKALGFTVTGDGRVRW